LNVPDKSSIFCSIKKEIYELFYNKASLFLSVFALVFVIFLPLIDKQFMNIPEISKSKSYVLLSMTMCVLVVSQRLFDGLKNDFSSGGAIFLINSGCSCRVYLFGKKLVSFVVIFVLLIFRLKEFSNIFNIFDFLLLFMFFDFLINNSFLFSMLFYTKNTNILSYLFMMIIPIMMVPLILQPKLFVLKIITLLIFIGIENAQIPKIYNSRRFRFNLS